MRFLSAILLMLGVAGMSEGRELTIGLIPEQNVFKQVKRYEPIGAYIGRKSGLTVKFTMLSRYGNILDSFVERKMDAAFWGSFTGAMAIKQLGVEPVARPIWHDGTSTYHGYILVRKDSDIKTVADMKGRSMAFVERATTAGYVFPLAYLKGHGVNDIDEYFADYYFAGSHDAAIYAVLERKADIGSAKNTIYNIVSGKDPRIKEELVILEESPRVPSNGLGVRKDLEASVRLKLKDILLGMDRDPEGRELLKNFGAIRFVATTKDDYGPVFDLAEKAGIELEKYHYINK